MRGRFIEIRLEPTPEDWTVAISDDLPGLFVSHPNREDVLSDIPDAIVALFKAQYGVDVRVVMLEPRAQGAIPPYVAIPEELLIQHPSP